MKNTILIILLLAFDTAFSKQEDTLALELTKVVLTKIDYEKFEQLAQRNATRYSERRDSAYTEYIAQINKIKKNPAKNLKYIDTKMALPETKKNPFFYNYVNTTLPFDRNQYAISRYDFYRVIRHNLFEEKAAVLPKTLDDIPFPVKRDYSQPFKLQKMEDVIVDDKKVRKK